MCNTFCIYDSIQDQSTKKTRNHCEVISHFYGANFASDNPMNPNVIQMN